MWRSAVPLARRQQRHRPSRPPTGSASSCSPDDDWGLKTGKSENRLRQKLDLLNRGDLRFNQREPALEFRELGPEPFAFQHTTMRRLRHVRLRWFLRFLARLLCRFGAPGARRAQRGRGRHATHSAGRRRVANAAPDPPVGMSLPWT